MEIKILDVKRAVVQKLKSRFPDYKVYSSRVEQGMKAPAFHLDIIPFEAPKVGKYMYHIHYFVNCTFFPTVEGDLDQNLEAWEGWRKEFIEPFELPSGQWVTPQEQKCVMMDALYRFSFNIEEIYLDVPEDTTEKMIEIEINYRGSEY